MNTQHKWNKEIKAWADGAIIQFKDSHDENIWQDCSENFPFWELSESVEYRIKPQPKEPQYLYIFTNAHGVINLSNSREEDGLLLFKYIGKIKLEEEC